MCACDDSVSRAEKFRRSIDGLKRGALIGCHPRNFCAQNDVFVGVRVGFVLRLTLDKQIGMCPPPKKKHYKSGTPADVGAPALSRAEILRLFTGINKSYAWSATYCLPICLVLFKIPNVSAHVINVVMSNPT